MLRFHRPPLLLIGRSAVLIIREERISADPLQPLSQASRARARERVHMHPLIVDGRKERERGRRSQTT